MTIDEFHFDDVEVTIAGTTVTIGNMTVSLGTADDDTEVQ